MEHIKKIILEVLHEIEIEEAAVEASNLGEEVAWIEIEDGQGVLYDTSNKKVLGMSLLVKRGEFYEQTGVAAEKGYGPLVMELSMMRVFPKGVVTDRDMTSDDARKVWNYFYYKRSDVRKSYIDQDSPHFRPKEDEYYNSIMRKPKNDSYMDLVMRGYRYIYQSSNQKKALSRVNRQSQAFFQKKFLSAPLGLAI